jgi:hypothetical protein
VFAGVPSDRRSDSFTRLRRLGSMWGAFPVGRIQLRDGVGTRHPGIAAGISDVRTGSGDPKKSIRSINFVDIA